MFQMGKTAILTDTNSGITPEEAKEIGIFLMPMPVYLDDELFYEGVNITMDDFFTRQVGGAKITTSMPSVGDVMDKWDELLSDHDEVVYIPMSSGLSSSCETAAMLTNDEDYSGKVFVVDNHRISVTMKLSVYEAKALADQGKSGSEIKTYLEDHKSESSIYITVDTLKYLKNGGRLTPAVAAIGTILHIKPVLTIQGGKLDTFGKARSLHQARDVMMNAIIKDTTERFESPDGEGCVISISHTHNPEEAEEFRRIALEHYPDHTIFINPLPISIACHIGPGSLAITTSQSFITDIAR